MSFQAEKVRAVEGNEADEILVERIALRIVMFALNHERADCPPVRNFAGDIIKLARGEAR